VEVEERRRALRGPAAGEEVLGGRRETEGSLGDTRLGEGEMITEDTLRRSLSLPAAVGEKEEEEEEEDPPKKRVGVLWDFWCCESRSWRTIELSGGEAPPLLEGGESLLLEGAVGVEGLSGAAGAGGAGSLRWEMKEG